MTDQPSRSDSRSNRQRRRRRQPTRIDHSVASPCQAVCRFDGEPFCVGCFRNADEIREWMIMSREQKLEVLARLPARRKAAEQ